MSYMQKNWLGLVAVAAVIAAGGCSHAPPAGPSVNVKAVSLIRAELDLGSGGGSEGAAAKGEPKGWATLSGTIKLAGGAAAAPAPKPVNITKDPATCAPGGKQVFSDDILVGPSGGIANVLVYLSSEIAPTEPWTHPTAKDKKDPFVFDQKACRFLSHVSAVQVTQPVLIKNSDDVGHNTALNTNSSRKFDQTIPQGGSDTYNFTAAEGKPFPVSCAVHPWMRAYMIARPNGYFAVTDNTGKFEIPNLPAGVELQVAVWHELANSPKEAELSDASVKFARGKLVVTLEPEKPMNVEVTFKPDLFSK